MGRESSARIRFHDRPDLEEDGGADFDVDNRRCTIGLSDRLEEYFDQQILATKRAGSSPCPGEEVCQQIGPLSRYRDAPIETTCGGCSKLGTKPGTQPRILANAIAEALGLDELKSVGATFAYPDALSPYQWTCLRSLERARQREKERISKQQVAEAEQQRLQSRLGRP